MSDQASFLGRVGVGLLQGFLFSRPVEAEAFTAMVVDEPAVGACFS